MRILHINSALNWAGGEVHTYLVCKELVQRGCDVTLACREKSAIDEAFECAGLRTIRLGLKNALDLVSSYKMAQFCRQHNIHIIHAHLGRDYWLAAWIKFFNPSVQIVFTRHVLKPIPQSIFRQWLFAQATKIIAVSEAVEANIIESGLVEKEKVVRIYNGIDVKRFSQALPGKLRHAMNFDSTTKIIGITGQVSPHKGQDVLIKSLPALLECHADVQCVIIGDDFKGGTYINELKALAKSLEVEKKVHFMGQRDDIPELLKDFDVFALASREEAFGLVIVEAMAAGIPVVATKCRGAAEIIANEQSGLLVDYGDSASMASALDRLLTDTTLREKIIKNAYTKTVSMFCYEKMIQELMNVYLQVKKDT